MMGKIDSIIERCLTLKINESKQQYIQDTFDAFLAAKVKNRIQSKSSTDRSKNNSEGRLVV